MNIKLSITCFILIIVPFFLGCHMPATVKQENALANSAPMGQKYTIDIKESPLTWEGSMVFGFNEKSIGYVYLSKGELMVEKGKLVGGNVEINMNSIEYADKTSTSTPVKHLKSPDYFDVKKFPIATFAITKVESVNVRSKTIKITGNLTIKGVTNPVTFPARIEIKDGVIRADGKLVIDRTDWGIRYKSGKFYDNLADHAVSDDIELQMKIVAKKINI